MSEKEELQQQAAKSGNSVTEEMASDRETRIFAEAPVGKAVASMIIPTIVSQIILVIYNLADTWYVGLTENAAAVAAVSLCLPVYNILSAVSNLFGIGGAGALARALGVHDHARARRLLGLSIGGALGGAILYALLMGIFSRPLLLLIGGDTDTIDYAVTYVFWTIVVGGIPTIVGPACGHLIRAMGHPRTASFGMILGCVLNIILDPVFMFVLLPPGNEVAGAAMATALSNTVGLIYFGIYLYAHKKNTLDGQKEKKKAAGGRLFGEIVKGGIPGFCMVALAMFSNCFLNSMISSLGSAAVAGLGIVRKIDQLAYAVNQGVTQGMLPLVAYCYSAGRRKRMWAAVGISTAISEGFSLICTAVSFLFSTQLIWIFIRDPETIRYGAEFLQILCLAVPIYTLTFVIIAVFQAAGRGVEPFILSVLHKGSLDIILLFVLRQMVGTEHILWATIVSESAALIAGAVMLAAFWKKTS
ncbi:MAG TPA: polysaccharide biosynthesis C-terminal domain-containing protein [Candidatus Blautia excrementipullorum]|nr:polysaccharide biosynthesis C-terminal domain-containing protein [Candidatus Blautia excrementipullorum]